MFIWAFGGCKSGVVDRSIPENRATFLAPDEQDCFRQGLLSPFEDMWETTITGTFSMMLTRASACAERSPRALSLGLLDHDADPIGAGYPRKLSAAEPRVQFRLPGLGKSGLQDSPVCR